MSVSREVFYQAVDAIITGDIPALKTLLDTYPALKNATSPEKKYGAPLLYYCAANGVEDDLQVTPDNALEVLRVLLDAGIDPDSLPDKDNSGLKWTPLCMLVSSVHPARKGLQADLARVLVAYGARVNGLDDDGLPLATAIAFRYRQTAHVLVEIGARVDNIIFASALGDLAQVKQRLADEDYGTYTEPFSRPLDTPEKMKGTGFVYACMAGEIEVMQTLVSAGVDINTMPLGRTGLHEASETGQLAVAKFLLENGADLSLQDPQGFTAMHWASWHGNIEMMDLLLEHGAPLEIKQNYGGTVLDTMVWSRKERNYPEVDYPAVIRKLLEHGADISAVEILTTPDEAVNAILREYQSS